MSRRSRLALQFAAFVATAPAWAGPITLNVVGVAGPAPEALIVVAQPVASAGALKPTEKTVTIRGGGRLVLPPGVWRLSGQADGFWVKEEVVNVAEQIERVTLRAWPMGEVAGRLSVPAGSLEPDAVNLRVRTTPGVKKQEALEESVLKCPVSSRGWSCRVPAVPLDVVVHARGYIPHYKWDVRVDPGQRVQLGTFAFEKGSSVAGRVTLPDGAPARTACRVSILSRDGQPMAPVGHAHPFAANVNHRGFYQIRHVPRGPYLVRAEQAGWAHASALINVGDGVETQVDPLRLEAPQTLELALDPSRSPDGGLWKIRLVSVEGGPQWVEQDGIANGDGTWRRAGLSPGPYWVMVSDSRGRQWLHREIDVVPGLGRVELTLDTVMVSGTVRLGDKPLEASLLFGGRRGAVRVPLQSNADGEFEGLIPERSEWDVFVEASDPPVQRTLTGVRPASTTAGGRREVHLRLPDTTLIVTAVDETGKPVRALVNVQSVEHPDRMVQGWAQEPKAQLEVHGLPEGEAILVAQARDRSAPDETTRLEEGSTARVDFVLRPNTRIVGRIVDENGVGVPLARIVAHPGESARFWPVPAVLTDAEGNFELAHLPVRTRDVALTVGARGFVLKKLRAGVANGRLADIALEHYGGVLVLELASHQETDEKEPLPYLLFGGSFAPLWELRSWASANSEQLRGVSPPSEPGERETLQVPQMAPGQYALCIATLAERIGIAAGKLPSACSRGVLAPGGVLPLSDPALRDEGRRDP